MPVSAFAAERYENFPASTYAEVNYRAETIKNSIYLALGGAVVSPKEITLPVMGNDYGTIKAETGTMQDITDKYGSVIGKEFIEDKTLTPDNEGKITVEAGKTLRLTAVPVTNGRFYGWTDGNGSFISSDLIQIFEVSENKTYKAVFSLENTYAARLDDVFYTEEQGGLQKALEDAKENSSIMIYKDAVLTKNAVIPKGAQLYIPFDSSYRKDGHIFNTGSNALADEKKTYCTLTIDNGVTLTVDGSIVTGGVMSGSMNGYQGHTSGSHGKILNNGDIAVRSGGKLDMWGYLEGSGTVTAYNGSYVYEPFIVLDFLGGTNTLAFSEEQRQSPFKHYTMQNIRTRLVLKADAQLIGHCSLVTDGNRHNEANVPIIAKGKSLFATKSGTTIVRTVDRQKNVNGITYGKINYKDIGTVHYEVTGGLIFQSMSMELMGILVDMSHVDFPIPYTYSFELKGGEYLIANKIKLLPGAEMTVAKDASLTVSGIGFDAPYSNKVKQYPSLYVMDALKETSIAGKIYPTSEQLADNGFSKSATLKINGNLTVEKNAALGGTIQTDGTGKVVIEQETRLYTPNLQTGGHSTNGDNRSYIDCKAKLNIGGVITDMAENTTYIAKDGVEFILSEYSPKYMEDSTDAVFAQYQGGKNPTDEGYMHNECSPPHILVAEKNISLNQKMSGSWEIKPYEGGISGGGMAGGGGAAKPEADQPKTENGITSVEASALPVVSGNEAKAKIELSDVSKLIEDVLNAANKNGTKALLEIKMDTPANVTQIETNVQSSVLNALSTGNTELKIKSSVADVVIPSKVLKDILNGGKENGFALMLKTQGLADLNESQRKALGNNAGNAVILKADVTSGTSKIQSFSEELTVSLPYTPKAGQNIKELVVWFVSDDGSIAPCNGSYNEKTGKYDFKTKHFSEYVLTDFPFADILSESWYYGGAAYCYNNSLMDGTDKNIFSPNMITTRGMLMTVLARGAKADTSGGQYWYSKGCEWAKTNGISDGSNPLGELTREQMVTMLYRYAKISNIDVSKGGYEGSSSYKDVSEISSYALPAMEWACKSGIIKGNEDKILNPKGTATRAEFAVILQRFLTGK